MANRGVILDICMDRCVNERLSILPENMSHELRLCWSSMLHQVSLLVVQLSKKLLIDYSNHRSLE